MTSVSSRFCVVHFESGQHRSAVKRNAHRPMIDAFCIQSYLGIHHVVFSSQIERLIIDIARDNEVFQLSYSIAAYTINKDINITTFRI